MLNCAVADPHGCRIARVGLRKNVRREGRELARPQIAHPSGSDRLNSADRFVHCSAQVIRSNDAVERGEEMS